MYTSRDHKRNPCLHLPFQNLRNGHTQIHTIVINSKLLKPRNSRLVKLCLQVCYAFSSIPTHPQIHSHPCKILQHRTWLYTSWDHKRIPCLDLGILTTKSSGMDTRKSSKIFMNPKLLNPGLRVYYSSAYKSITHPVHPQIHSHRCKILQHYKWLYTLLEITNETPALH